MTQNIASNSSLKDANKRTNMSTNKITLDTVMANIILAETSASVSELKKNPMGTVAAGEGFPVAILNRNEPAFYCIPAKAYEALIEKLEDMELNAIADARENQAEIKVNLSDL